MPVARGFLRQSGDGSIKSFVIILTAIGLLFFVYYKFKSSQLCADQVSDIDRLKIEVSRLKATAKACFDKVEQKEHENAKLFNQDTQDQDDTKNQDLENARKEAADKTIELAQVKNELEKCQEPKKHDSNDGTCSDIKEMYEKEIEDLKQQLQALKESTPASGPDPSYDQKDHKSSDVTKTDKDSDVPKITEFNQKDSFLPKKENQAYDNDDEVEKKDEPNIITEKQAKNERFLPKEEIQADHNEEVEEKDDSNIMKEKLKSHESNSFSGFNRSKDTNNDFANRENNNDSPYKKQGDEKVFPQQNNFEKVENKIENEERKDSVERIDSVFNIAQRSKAGNLSGWTHKKLDDSGNSYKNQIEKAGDISQQHFDEIARSDKKREGNVNAADGEVTDPLEKQDSKNSLVEQEVPQLKKRKKHMRFEGSDNYKMDKKEDHLSENFLTKGSLVWNSKKPAVDSLRLLNNNQDPWKQESVLKRDHPSSDINLYKQKSSMIEPAVRDIPSEKKEKELS